MTEDWRVIKDDEWVRRKLKRDENFNLLPEHPDYVEPTEKESIPE